MKPDSALTCEKGNEPNPSVVIRRKLQLALTFLKSRDLEQANAVLKEVIRIDPENADALHLLGMIAHDSGKSDTAVDLIRRAVSLDPIQPMFYNNLGNVFLSQGDLDSAAACFQD